MGDEPLRIDVGGREVEAERVHITTSQEAFNTYLLEDGSTIRIKLVVTDILRASSAQDSQGNPIYLIKSKNVTDVQASRK